MSDIKVVNISTINPEIICVAMEDRLNKNIFSNELVSQLIEAFSIIKENTLLKVVILTGFDSYFASGGSKDSLLAIHEDRASFTDLDIYRLALDCPIPVIAAMQGHGIGGGFVMGLFCDFIILSRESVYTTNFMNYGFTPGMGATLIVPNKIGNYLGYEMLMLAQTFRGEELKSRGIQLPVIPRTDVMSKAIEMADALAAKPRLSLITLKNHMNKYIKEKLPAIIEDELEMHKTTFHQPEVGDRIRSIYLNNTK